MNDNLAEIQAAAGEAKTFLQLMRSDKRIWIACAVSAFIGFVAGAVVL